MVLKVFYILSSNYSLLRGSWIPRHLSVYAAAGSLWDDSTCS